MLRSSTCVACGLASLPHPALRLDSLRASVATRGNPVDNVALRIYSSPQHRAGLLLCSGAFRFILSGKNYFLLAQNNAHSHPMPVQLNTQLPKRTKIISCFPRAVWRAIHAGAKNIPMASNAAIAYFAIIKIWCVVIIGPQKKGGRDFAPRLLHFR